MQGLKYKDWFSVEYTNRIDMKNKLELIYRQIFGKKLQNISKLYNTNLYRIELQGTYIYFWYRDTEHCKIRIDTKKPEKRNAEDISSRFSEIIGKQLLTINLDTENMDRRNFNKISATFGKNVFGSETKDSKFYELKIVYDDEKMNGSIKLISGDNLFTDRYAIVSNQKIRTQQNSYKLVIFDKIASQKKAAIVDVDNNIKIPPVYDDLQLNDSVNKYYRTCINDYDSDGNIIESYYGEVDEIGKEIIPCKYKDVYCMRNGFFMVLDVRYNCWWVLNKADEIIFGPDIKGVDIGSDSEEYIYFIDFNEEKGKDTLGIYNIKKQEKTMSAMYDSISYIHKDRFLVIYYDANRDEEVHTIVNEYGESIMKKNYSGLIQIRGSNMHFLATIINDDGKSISGIIDEEENIVFPFLYGIDYYSITRNKDRIIVKDINTDKFGIVSMKNEIIYPLIYGRKEIDEYFKIE